MLVHLIFSNCDSHVDMNVFITLLVRDDDYSSGQLCLAVILLSVLLYHYSIILFIISILLYRFCSKSEKIDEKGLTVSADRMKKH